MNDTPLSQTGVNRSSLVIHCLALFWGQVYFATFLIPYLKDK